MCSDDTPDRRHARSRAGAGAEQPMGSGRGPPAQVLEDSGVEPPRAGPSLLQVLPAHVLLEPCPQILLWLQPAQVDQHPPKFRLQIRIDRDQVLLSRPSELQP